MKEDKEGRKVGSRETKAVARWGSLSCLNGQKGAWREKGKQESKRKTSQEREKRVKIKGATEINERESIEK